MAKKQTQLEKVLAEIDDQVDLLVRSRAMILKAIAEAPKRKARAKKTTKAEPAAAGDDRR